MPGYVKILDSYGFIKNDDNQCEELYSCGRCGVIGTRYDIPEEVLKVNNVIIYNEKNININSS